MTKEQRKEQIRQRLLLAGLVTAELVGLGMFIAGCERVLGDEAVSAPVAGFTAEMNEAALNPITIVEEEPAIVAETEEEEELVTFVSDYVMVEATAYTDTVASGGRPLIEGWTVAGKVEWLDREVSIYRCNEDGSVGELIGHYKFLDTGYGQPTGYGQSKIIKGMTIGTIEAGECIDIFMESEADCNRWGRQKVYIQFRD